MEWFLRFGLVLLKVLALLLAPVFWAASLGNRKKVPAMSNSVLFLSATCLAEKIRKREVKSEEIVKAYIERIKIVNPIINAVVEDRFNDAIEEAIAVDRYLDSVKDTEEIRTTQPLLGVPLTVKESCQLKDMSICVGSKPRIGMRASADGEAVGLLRNAGAIPLLVSNTPEYCMYWESNNLVTGCTRNPYRTDRSPAGSSGGEGALLGSGASVIGIGSDLAGSIRLPALFCGVFGHKPSPYIVSNDGHFPALKYETMQYYLALGPLTRYSEDLVLMMRILSGKNAEKLRLNDKINLSNLNIFHMKELGKSISFPSVDPEIQQLINKSVQYLQQQCKCSVMKKTFEMGESLEATCAILYSQDEIPNILKNDKTQDNLPLEFIKSMFRSSKYSRNGLFFSFLAATNGFVPKSQLRVYEKKINDLKMDFVDSLGENGVFLYPTFHSAAYQHNRFLLEIGGVSYLSIFNVLGCPSTHIPMGLNSKGLPIGIQVAAAPNQDRLCLAVARELEKAFGGWVQPP